MGRSDSDEEGELHSKARGRPPPTVEEGDGALVGAKRPRASPSGDEVELSAGADGRGRGGRVEDTRRDEEPRVPDRAEPRPVDSAAGRDRPGRPSLEAGEKEDPLSRHAERRVEGERHEERRHASRRADDTRPPSRRHEERRHDEPRDESDRHESRNGHRGPRDDRHDEKEGRDRHGGRVQERGRDRPERRDERHRGDHEEESRKPHAKEGKEGASDAEPRKPKLKERRVEPILEVRAMLAADARGPSARIADVMAAPMPVVQAGGHEGAPPAGEADVDGGAERSHGGGGGRLREQDPMWAAAAAAAEREAELAALQPQVEAEAAEAAEAAAKAKAAAEAEAAEAAAAAEAEAAEWISIQDSCTLWQLVQANAAAQPRKAHPDAQPVPPGAYDLPAAVELLAAKVESDAAAAAMACHSAEVRNAELLEADRAMLQPARSLAAEVCPVQTPTAAEAWAAEVGHFGKKRLVVLCGASLSILLDHPVLLDHAHILECVSALTEEECAARGGCDSLAELWRVLEAGDPFVVLEISCGARRTRKQLLHRLSKQPSAAQYSVQVLVGPDLDHASTPSVEEGWASVI
ncbi:hypothetical protein AB1Y20_006730 [Prymnesium parvum]|uniref:Uncharacterized protein n=1 Tax=Prymnesium parvum TaxID=97485 RepID=A0AB34IZ45_PRYPA